MEIGDKAVKLILQFEGWDVPWVWPGGASGITISRGYDLAWEPFAKDWQGLLDATTFKRLNAVVGLKGQAAKKVATSLKGIKIPVTAADMVFRNITLPKYIEQTKLVFPNSDTILSPDGFGALVSLVYNRGMLVDETDRRREMLALHKAFVNGTADKDFVAAQLKGMARLWADNKSSDGDLHDRRIAEANLVLAT